jgi:hypothetical protein
MNARRCIKIASRIGTLLEKEIGLGIDARRMLTERLYMRDVLLVCDAHRGNELAELAQWFRRSAAQTPCDSVAPSRVGSGSGSASGSGFGIDSGFNASGFGSSEFDAQREPVLPAAALLVRHQLEQQRAAARRGGWLSALRAR